MRTSILAVILLLSVGACGSQDTAHAPTRGAAPAPARDAAPAPAAVSTSPDRSSASMPVAAVPQVSKWELDPENSSAEFVCRHVFSKIRGMFAKPSGTVLLDEATPANSRVHATIDVNLITTGVEERDMHLKSADFFDVATYPTMTFESTDVSGSSPTSYSVTGNLTMHGVTLPVILAVTVSPPFHHAGGIRRGVEATTSVNRKDFGLRWEFPGEDAGVVVGDNIEITINAELVLQPEPSNSG